MTAVPFSYDEQRRIDSAKRYEKAAAQLRKEAEDTRKERQMLEDARASVIAVEAEARRKEREERLRVNEQREKFRRGMATLRTHFTERIGLYDAKLVKFGETRDFSDDSTIITIHLQRKP